MLAYKFQSNIAKYIFWLILVIALLIDVYGLWLVFGQQVQVAIFSKIIMLLSVAFKLAILFCLLTNKGAIKALTYVWGSLFIMSGSTGLLSFTLSKALEPIQAYIDKALFIIVGVALITMAKKYIEYAQP